MLRSLRQKVGMPMLLLSLAVGGLCLSVMLSPLDEAQTLTTPPSETQTAPTEEMTPTAGEKPEAVALDPLESAPAERIALAAGEKPEAVALDPPEPEALEEDPESPFEPIILEASTRYEVEPELIRAMIMAESRFDAKAVSPKGARGLMQLMPLTAKAMGVDDLFDPQGNITGGVKYLRLLLDHFQGNVTLALAAYHAGGSRVRKHKGVPPIAATHRYVKEVFQYYDSYKRETNG